MPQVETMVAVVVNRTAAPFALSDAAARRIGGILGIAPADVASEVPRNHEVLVAAVKLMGALASGPGCDLRAVEVPVYLDIETDGDAEEVSVHGGSFSLG